MHTFFFSPFLRLFYLFSFFLCTINQSNPRTRLFIIPPYVNVAFLSLFAIRYSVSAHLVLVLQPRNQSTNRPKHVAYSMSILFSVCTCHRTTCIAIHLKKKTSYTICLSRPCQLFCFWGFLVQLPPFSCRSHLINLNSTRSSIFHLLRHAASSLVLGLGSWLFLHAFSFWLHVRVRDRPPFFPP